MLREIANDFYMNQNYNCGECILRAANKAYDLGLDERALKLASGFGAGMGCGNTCGALSAAMSVLSLLFCGELLIYPSGTLQTGISVSGCRPANKRPEPFCPQTFKSFQ